MTCHEFDKLLHPYVDGEFDATERLDVESHLALCPGCARKVHAEKQFRDGLRLKLKEASFEATQRAPESLRTSVIASIRAEHRRRQTRSLMSWASAAAAVMVVGAVTWNFLPKRRERFVVDATERHARALPAEIPGGAPEAVEAWFGGKLDHRVPVPRFPNAQVAGARLSNVQERPAAYIRYQKPDSKGTPKTIGLFVFGDSDGDVEAEPLPSAELETRLGYNVAIWRDGEIVYQMVTDLDEGDVRALLEAQQRGTASVSPPSPVNAPAPIAAPPAQTPTGATVVPAMMQ